MKSFPSLLVFGSHTELPSEQVLQDLRQDLISIPELFALKQAVEDLDAETVKALDGPYRCVPLSLSRSVSEVWEAEGDGVLREVEREWNFRAGNKRCYTRGVIGGRDCTGFQRECELMEYVYRTTVLEPINRFCAYFPDINECTYPTPV